MGQDGMGWMDGWMDGWMYEYVLFPVMLVVKTYMATKQAARVFLAATTQAPPKLAHGAGFGPMLGAGFKVYDLTLGFLSSSTTRPKKVQTFLDRPST